MQERSGHNLFKRIDKFTCFYKTKIMSFHRNQSVKGLSPLEFTILNEIATPEKMQVSLIAHRLNLSMPNCSRYVRWLIKGGFAKKKQDDNDKRVFYITPTNKGIDIIKKALLETEKKAMSFISNLSQNEIDKLIECMDFIEDTFSEME